MGFLAPPSAKMTIIPDEESRVLERAAHLREAAALQSELGDHPLESLTILDPTDDEEEGE